MNADARAPEAQPAAQSARSESPGMFVDQPENSPESSPQVTSPQLSPGNSSPQDDIGDPMSIDDDEPNYSDDVDCPDQAPNSQIGGANADHSSDNDSSTADHGGADDDQADSQEDEEEDEEGDEEDDELDEDAGASDTASVRASIQLAQTGNSGCGRCTVLGSRIAKQEERMEEKIDTIRELRRVNRSLRRELDSVRKKLDHQQSDVESQEIATLRTALSYANKRLDRRQSHKTYPVITHGPGTREGPRLWHRALHDLIHTPEDAANSWGKVLRICAREENYPLNQLHPYIRLVGTDVDRESAEGDSKRQASPVAPIAFCEQFTRAFPDEILVKILHEVLVFEGNLVFVLSRLDPFVRLSPAVNLPVSNSCSGLPARFYINNVPSEISLTYDTISPGRLLAPLVVSRKWNYFGVSEFYGGNTFAFSSFGELDRFCNGIRKPRVQRISHVEVHWMGGQSVQWRDGKRPSKRVDTRVAPLAWLAEMNLKSLCIFIDESSPKVTRRPREPKAYQRYAKEMTAGQPNARMFRALRASRGMDWVHLLRGMQFINLYDTTKMIATKDRNESEVRDKSAVIDLNRTARMEKTPTRAYKALLHNLDPLFDYKAANKWEPGLKDFRLLQRTQKIYDLHASFDLRKNDLDIDCNPKSGTPPRSEASDDEDDEDDTEGEPDDSGDSSAEDDDSTDSGSDDPDRPQGLATPPSLTCEEYPARRSPSPAPGFGGSVFDSSEDEDEAGEDGVGDAGYNMVDDQDEPDDDESSNVDSDDGESDGESDGEPEDESGDDGAGNVEEEASVRRHHMNREFPLPQPDDLAGFAPDWSHLSEVYRLRRARSLGGISSVSHLTEQLQAIPWRFKNRQDSICIEGEDEEDDDDVQILSKAPRNWLLHNGRRSRSGATRRSSSGLFCTPNPDERSVTGTAEPQATPAGSSSSPVPGMRARAAYIRNWAPSSAPIDLTTDDSDDGAVDKVLGRQAGPSPSPSRRPETGNQQREGVKRETGSPYKSPLPQDDSRGGERSLERDVMEPEAPATELPQHVHLGDNGGRAGSYSPQPRVDKRVRDGGSAAEGDPSEPVRKKAKAFQS